MAGSVQQLPVKHSREECTKSLGAVADALYVIGGKWKLPLIVALSDGHQRFNELQRAVNGISAKVLSKELKDLEINGFLIRRVYDAQPVIVEYELTPYSDSLHEVTQALHNWGAQHKEKIMGKKK
jgi:DNA-binding HxlR family transcriptional regulator